MGALRVANPRYSRLESRRYGLIDLDVIPDDIFLMQRKIRFGDLVRNSGRPQAVTLWTDPKKDPNLSRAVRSNRVLTVFEDPGVRPHGSVGLHPGPHSIFLVFPEPLPKQPEARVIGINYQLLEQPEVKHAVQAPAAQPKPKPRIAKPKPVKRNFTARLRRTATLDETRRVEARDSGEAEKEAMHTVSNEPFDVSRADMQVKVAKVE